MTDVLRRPAPSPRPDPLPTFSVRQGPLSVERHGTGYTPAERLRHCVEHGIALYPVVHCRYPSPRSPE